MRYLLFGGLLLSLKLVIGQEAAKIDYCDIQYDQEKHVIDLALHAIYNPSNPVLFELAVFNNDRQISSKHYKISIIDTSKTYLDVTNLGLTIGRHYLTFKVFQIPTLRTYRTLVYEKPFSIDVEKIDVVNMKVGGYRVDGTNSDVSFKKAVTGQNKINADPYYLLKLSRRGTTHKTTSIKNSNTIYGFSYNFFQLNNENVTLSIYDEDHGSPDDLMAAFEIKEIKDSGYFDQIGSYNKGPKYNLKIQNANFDDEGTLTIKDTVINNIAGSNFSYSTNKSEKNITYDLIFYNRSNQETGRYYVARNGAPTFIAAANIIDARKVEMHRSSSHARDLFLGKVVAQYIAPEPNEIRIEKIKLATGKIKKSFTSSKTDEFGLMFSYTVKIPEGSIDPSVFSETLKLQLYGNVILGSDTLTIVQPLKNETSFTYQQYLSYAQLNARTGLNTAQIKLQSGFEKELFGQLFSQSTEVKIKDVNRYKLTIKDFELKDGTLKNNEFTLKIGTKEIVADQVEVGSQTFFSASSKDEVGLILTNDFTKQTYRHILTQIAEFGVGTFDLSNEYGVNELYNKFVIEIEIVD